MNYEDLIDIESFCWGKLNMIKIYVYFFKYLVFLIWEKIKLMLVKV